MTVDAKRLTIAAISPRHGGCTQRSPMRASRFSVMLAVLPLAGCAGPAEAEGATTSPVVGGHAETAQPAAGYLAFGKGGALRATPLCGATLIGPRTAVTAAHCIVDARDHGYDAFGWGLGAAGGTVFRAARTIVHPGYERNGIPGVQEPYRHDVAVVILERAPAVVPLEIGSMAVPQQAGTYIGYGRTTPGDETVTEGYTHERKSASLTIEYGDGQSLHTKSIDGGLCWGDSGGPVISRDQVLGVLADFEGEPSCEVGHRMIFTSLADERAFLDGATP